jgi:hypothetical protein
VRLDASACTYPPPPGCAFCAPVPSAVSAASPRLSVETRPVSLATGEAATAAATAAASTAEDGSLSGPVKVLKLVHALGVPGLDRALFVNRRLTNKLTVVLGDPLAVCAGALPPWCRRLAHDFPLLVPLAVRLELFKATATGVSRCVQRFSELAFGPNAAQQSSTLKRQKAILPRGRALESAMVLMPKLTRAVLTVEFAEEIGHGARRRRRRRSQLTLVAPSPQVWARRSSSTRWCAARRRSSPAACGGTPGTHWPRRPARPAAPRCSRLRKACSPPR